SDGNFNSVLEEAIRTGITAPSVGLHTLGVRFKGLDGTWGSDFKSVFNIDTQYTATFNVVEAEYFFDTDPGEGNGTALVAADGNFDNAVEVALASASSGGLTQDLHVLSVRAKGVDGT